MSAEYSVEEVKLAARVTRGIYQLQPSMPKIADMLDCLSERIKAGEGAVTDEVVERAIVAYARIASKHIPVSAACMRRALLAVWPTPPAQAAHANDAITDYYTGRNRGGWAAPRNKTAREEAAEPAAQGEACDSALTAYRDAWNATGTPWRSLTAAEYLAHQHAVLALAAQPAERVVEGWRETFAELLEDYAGARAETAVWNVTQRLQPEGGIRMPRPRLAKLMDHVDQLTAAPAASPAGVPGGYVPVFALPEHFGWADESDRGRFDDAQKFLAGFGLVIAAPSPGESE